MKRRAVLAIVLALPAIVAARFMRHRKRAAGGAPHWTALMGGSSTQPSDLTHGFATVVMGGVELDLRQATRGATPATLDVAVVCGGLLVRVPEDWQVTLDVQPMMGGVRDYREDPSGGLGETPDLIVTGSVLMGGLAIAGDADLADLVGRRGATA